VINPDNTMKAFKRLVWSATVAGLLLLNPLLAEEAKLPDGLFRMEELRKNGKPPKIVKQPAPRYPSELARQGIMGAVAVAFIIDTRGEVARAEAIQSTNPGFNQAAIDAVKQWKFQPGELNGQKVNVLASQRIDFNLEDTR
jgi:TonB family protein